MSFIYRYIRHLTVMMLDIFGQSNWAKKTGTGTSHAETREEHHVLHYEKGNTSDSNHREPFDGDTAIS